MRFLLAWLELQGLRAYAYCLRARLGFQWYSAASKRQGNGDASSAEVR